MHQGSVGAPIGEDGNGGELCEVRCEGGLGEEEGNLRGGGKRSDRQEASVEQGVDGREGTLYLVEVVFDCWEVYSVDVAAMCGGQPVVRLRRGGVVADGGTSVWLAKALLALAPIRALARGRGTCDDDETSAAGSARCPCSCCREALQPNA